MTWATRPPSSLKHSYGEILRPLTLEVWLCTLAALALAAAVLHRLSCAEERVTGVRLSHWSEGGRTAIFAIGTLVGENVSIRAWSERAWSARWVEKTRQEELMFFPPFIPRIMAGTWMWISLVLSAGFGGNLRAFLMRPRYGDTISSVAQVARGGLPWEMIRYGGAGDAAGRNSKDPDIKGIYARRKLLPFEMYSYARVRRTVAFPIWVGYFISSSF